MKSLYESILDSDEKIMDTSKYSVIRDLILNAKTKKDIVELQKQWDDAELGVEGCHWKEGYSQIVYATSTTILICPYDKRGWDIEITRDTWDEYTGNIIRKLLEKLEKSGHFIIDKHPTGSKHWLAKIV